MDLLAPIRLKSTFGWLLPLDDKFQPYWPEYFLKQAFDLSNGLFIPDAFASVETVELLSAYPKYHSYVVSDIYYPDMADLFKALYWDRGILSVCSTPNISSVIWFNGFFVEGVQ
jgi:hypothetical protein